MNDIDSQSYCNTKSYCLELTPSYDLRVNLNSKKKLTNNVNLNNQE